MKGWNLLIIIIFLIMFDSLVSAEEPWYNGVWDSSLYNLSEKPRTVGIRIELIDSTTGIYISDAMVTLKGSFLDEIIGQSSIPPQEREFEMNAVSTEDGVVVFALSWQKEYPWSNPWSIGGTANYNIYSRWQKPVDDIEKVKIIEIRHPKYKFNSIPFDFNHLTEFGLGLFEEFENAWHKEMRKENVKYCILNFGDNFQDLDNKECSMSEFFNSIRAKDYGTVYQESENYYYKNREQSECGPFFIYILQIRLDRISIPIEINSGDKSFGKTNSAITTNSNNDIPGVNKTVINQGKSNSGQNHPLKIFIISGTLYGQSLNIKNPLISVKPGSTINGLVNIRVENGNPNSAIVPLAWTPTWGEPRNAYKGINRDVPNGTSSFTVSISNLITPLYEGTYYIIFALAGTYDYDQLMSLTYPSETSDWTKGRKISNLSPSVYDASIENGWCDIEWYNPSSNIYSPASIGMYAVKVIVK